MKKLFLFLFVCVSIISCSNKIDFENERQNYINETYKTAFEKEFGKNISKIHNWGFNPIITRSINPNANEWYIIPDEITDPEKQTVIEWFNTYKNPISCSVNWSDYFVQQVYGKHDNMDKLITSKDGIKEFDHVNNFNSTTGTIQLVQNGTTNAFGYHNSLDSKNHFEYTIQCINGSYYVGFDFEATGPNPNQQETKDGYYNDWIIKITPCIPKTTSAYRIMAEDLGYIGDFDFNDVVFDTYINYDPYYSPNSFGIIILRAVGGTLPIYVANQEAHTLFDVPSDYMINTIKRNEKPIVIFRFTPISNNPNDIEIKVKNNFEYVIEAERGKAPGKICVPSSVNWTDERVNIKTQYPKFTNWIEDENIKFWE